VWEHRRNLQGGIRGALVQFYAAHERFFHVHIENDHLVKVRDEMLVAVNVNVNFLDKSLPRVRKREHLSYGDGDGDAENVDRDDGHALLGAVGGGDFDDVGDVNVDPVHVVADTRVAVDMGCDCTVLPVDAGEAGHRKAVESTDPGIPDDDEDESDAREVSPKYSSTAAPQMPSPQLVDGWEVVPKLDSN
jgi:hypothetical protein